MVSNFYNKAIERLKQVRNIPDHKNSIEYREKCWDKYKNEVPKDLYALDSIPTDDELQDVLIAHQLYFKAKVAERISEGAFKGKYNTNDLNIFLSKPLKECFTGNDLNINQQGLDFLKEFVRDIIYDTKVKGKYPNPLKNLDDVRSYHRCICQVFIFNEGLTSLSVSKVTGVMQLTGSVQVVSNFRPLSAAVIYQKYMIDKTQNKEVNILVPSEGFFGRLLASYYVAKHNPDKIINYHTIDPNEALREPYEELVSFLKKQGGLLGRVTNWHPHIHWHGSEVSEARLRDSLGIVFDGSFTSPPYGATELYISSSDVYLSKVSDLSSNQKFLNTKKPEKGQALIRKVASEIKDLKVGQDYEHDGELYKILSIKQDTQSHSLGKNTETWNELFFRKTVQNMKYNIKDGGYQCWNVGNTRAHPTLEDDVVRICKEEGLIHENTMNYKLCRRPGSRHKPFGEPVFIFRKP